MRHDDSTLILSISPQSIDQLEKVLTLKGLGFLPAECVTYSPEGRRYEIVLFGGAVGHLLELLELAIDDRNAETWSERCDRLSSQTELDFSALDPHLRDECPAAM